MNDPAHTPPDILEIHKQIARLLSSNPSFQLIGLGRSDLDQPQYIAIEVRHLPSVPAKNHPASPVAR